MDQAAQGTLGVSTITMRNNRGTDHLSFDAVGLPGFQSFKTRWTTRAAPTHSNMDTYERLQPSDLAQIATVEAIFLYNAAMRDEMMPRKAMPTPNCTSSRSLR